MAENTQTPAARRVSVTITVRIDSVEQLTAMQIENAIRDITDDYQADVFANYGSERILPARG